MSNYAIVPTRGTTEMFTAFFAEDFTQNGYVEMLKAAPPPPENVLTDEEVHTTIRLSEGMEDSEFDLVRRVERAVLAKLTEPKS